MAFYGVSLLLALLVWRAGGLHWNSLPLIGLYAALLAWQAIRLRLDDPAGALWLFKANTVAAMLLLAAIVAGGR